MKAAVETHRDHIRVGQRYLEESEKVAVKMNFQGCGGRMILKEEIV